MQIRRKINGDMWTLKIVTSKGMRKEAGDKTTAGLCVAHEKTIYIRDDSVEYAVIAHELFHAFWSYLYLSDTNDIKLEDAEEIACTMFAAKGHIIVKKARQFTRELIKLHQEGEEHE